MRQTFIQLGLFIAVVSYSPLLNAAERPITGKAVPEFASLDKVVTDYMDRIGATAASLAVAKDGKLVYARAFGWSDRAHSKPATTKTTFRIASNGKPITAAIIRQLIHAKKLSLDTPVFKFLGLKPFNGKLGDERLKDVRVRHLIEHKGGWDKSESYDPTYRLRMIQNEMKLRSYPTSTEIIQFMLAQPLQFTPGEKRAYANLGYMILGRVIEKATGQKYNEVVQKFINKPLNVNDIRLSATKPKDRHPNEVYYPMESGLIIELRDSLGGLTASASSLCQFLQKYCMNGDFRNNRLKQRGKHFGSHYNSTTALMEQRTDGIDYVVLFNATRNAHYREDHQLLRSTMIQAIDQMNRKPQIQKGQ